MTPSFVTAHRIRRRLCWHTEARAISVNSLFLVCKGHEYTCRNRMSGAELALAIVPLVIVLVEHHRTVFKTSKALTFSKISNDEQLDFYEELHGELTLLHVILERVQTKSMRSGSSGAQPGDSQVESIAFVLGNSAEDFKHILNRVLKSINDLVREKSNALTQDDTVSPVL